MEIVLISVWLIVVFIICILSGYFGDSRDLTGWADKVVVYGCLGLLSLLWPFILILATVVIIPALCIYLGYRLKGTK